MEDTTKHGTVLIRDMLAEERPRERALKSGIKSLTDTELMAIVFSTGMKGKSVMELSREILGDNGGHLSKVAALSVREFMTRYKGIGKAKALTLLAALELGSRAAADAGKMTDPAITTSEQAYGYLRPVLERLDHEEFYVLYLSQSGRVKACSQIGRGGMSATAVDVRIAIREALLEKASSMILAHNHPSGNLRPSSQDIALTKKMAEAAALMDIRVIDHIIIGDNGFVSFNDEGLMPLP